MYMIKICILRIRVRFSSGGWEPDFLRVGFGSGQYQPGSATVQLTNLCPASWSREHNRSIRRGRRGPGPAALRWTAGYPRRTRSTSSRTSCHTLSA